ncbi:MAG: hypothetical protein RLZZ31_765 [Actinomycetota bacterium]
MGRELKRMIESYESRSGMFNDAESKPSKRWRIAVVLFIAIVVIGLAAFFIVQMREEKSFCDQVKNLPDISASLQKSDSPSQGLIDYANQLERLSKIAPDATTAAALQSLAQTQKSAGESFSGDSLQANSVAAIQALNTAQIQQAVTTLQQSINEKCLPQQ